MFKIKLTVKSVTYIIITIIAIGLFFAALSLAAITYNNNLESCFSFVCLGNIPLLFGDSFKIVSDTMQVAASVAVILGVLISVQTFVDSEEAKKQKQRQEHYNSFLKLVDSTSIKNILPNQRNSINKIYKACFETESPPVTLSSDYKNTIRNISKLIDTSNSKLTQQSGAFNKASHGSELYQLFSKLGIEPALKRNEDIESHEEIVFQMLDLISEAEPQNTIYLLDKKRKYHYK